MSFLTAEWRKLALANYEVSPDLLKPYLPFGTGPRACLGRQFAITEATLGLAMLLRRFEIREDRTSNPQVHYNLTTRLHGLRIRATPRAEDRAQQA